MGSVAPSHGYPWISECWNTGCAWRDLSACPSRGVYRPRGASGPSAGTRINASGTRGASSPQPPPGGGGGGGGGVPPSAPTPPAPHHHNHPAHLPVGVREAERIGIEINPVPYAVKEWRTKLVSAVQSASGRSDYNVVNWLNKAADEKVPINELANVPFEFSR